MSKELVLPLVILHFNVKTVLSKHNHILKSQYLNCLSENNLTMKLTLYKDLDDNNT